MVGGSDSESTGWFDASYKLILLMKTGLTLKIKLCDASSKDFQAWQAALSKALSRQSWLTARKAAAAGPKRFSDTDSRNPRSGTRAAHIGLGGLQRRQKQEETAGKALAGSAFRDLDSLMAKAREVVQLAERVAQINEQASRSGDSGATEEERAQFNSLVRSVGIASPVTRDSMGGSGSGDLFYSELARQLAGFVRPFLKKAGGMLALTDVYCLYNRARGSELVSPNDLLTACRQLQPLSLGMRLRTFESKVTVLQLDTFSDTAVAEKLGALALEVQKEAAAATNGDLAYGSGLSPLVVARRWRVSLLVAGEHLRTAEKEGALCRDDSAGGLRYFANFFLGWGSQEKGA
jgi:ESCRT-II complex subunit VPS36